MCYHRDRLHGSWLHIYIPLVHGHTHARTTVFHISIIIVTWMLDTLLSHVHTSLLHLLTVRVYMHVLLLSSCHMDPRSYYMYSCAILPYSCYMIVSCYWYGYTRYWTWELLICYMWNPTSIVSVILFLLYCSRDIVPVSGYIVPVILFYAINRAHVQSSCYPYHVQ